MTGVLLARCRGRRWELTREGTEIEVKPNGLLSKYGSGALRLLVAGSLYQEMMTLRFRSQLTDAGQDFIVAMQSRVVDRSKASAAPVRAEV
jgi:hypothetical protein